MHLLVSRDKRVHNRLYRFDLLNHRDAPIDRPGTSRSVSDMSDSVPVTFTPHRSPPMRLSA